MTRIQFLIILVAILASLGGGFWFGLQEGGHFRELVGAPLRGAIAVRALTDMKAGKTKGANLILEFEVQRGLLSLSELMESPSRRYIYSRLMEPDPFDMGGLAEQLASYRKMNPSPFTGKYLTHFPGETPEGRDYIDEAAERHREATRIINHMVEHYAK